jgi:hypothetical protein
MRVRSTFLALTATFLTTYAPPAVAHPEISHRIEALEEQLKTTPSPEVCSQLVELLFETKSCNKGLSYAESCLQKNQNDTRLVFATTRLAICTRNFPRAEELLQKLKASQGRTLQWCYLDIYLQEGHGDQSDILASITSLLELHPSAEPHIYLRAVALGRAIHPEQSAQYLLLLERGIANHPKSLPLRMGLLAIQESTNRHCDALKTIRDIMEAFPTLNQSQWLTRKDKAVAQCKQES